MTTAGSLCGFAPLSCLPRKKGKIAARRITKVSKRQKGTLGSDSQKNKEPKILFFGFFHCIS